MRRDDWLLAQLPIGMLEDDFFHRFVSIFQDVSTSLVDGADNIDNVADVTVAPPPLVRWLGSWIGLESVDASLPEELQRRIVRTAAETLVWRGTPRGLTRFLELISGGPVEVTEGGGVWPEGQGDRRAPWVRMRVASTGWLSEADFAALVRDEVPAHVDAELWVGERRLWPAEPVAALAAPVGEGALR